MFYKVIRFIGYVLTLLFWPIKTKGKKYLIEESPLILAANHISYLDPIVLGVAVRRQIHFIAKKEVFNIPILGFIIKSLGAIPVDRKKANPVSIKKTFLVLKKGNILGIFPEGARSMNGELLEFNIGLIKIALKAKSPIIPVGINGTFSIYPPKAKFPSFFKRENIYINFGEPIYLDNTRAKDIKYQKESLLLIKEKIKELANSL